MDANDLAELLAAAKPVYALTKVRFGQPFAVVRDPQTKAFRCFKYEINQEKYLIVEKKDDRFVARLEEIDYQTSLAVIKGEIKSTLSGAVTEQGENVALAIALANVFASEINFISDLREGDAFEVLVESVSAMMRLRVWTRARCEVHQSKQAAYGLSVPQRTRP